jgi:hypothetical protein
MAQSTVLAAGNGAAASSTIVVAAGAKVTVGLFVAAGAVPSNCSFNVAQKTPGADIPLPISLSASSPRLVLDAPGSYVVNRVSGGSTTATGQLRGGKAAYVVTAVNAQGESLPSAEVVATLLDASNNAVSLSWAAITGATSYNVYRGTYPGGENTLQSVGNVTAFTDVGAGAAGTPPVANTSVLAAPVQAASSTATAGGTLAAATYYYKIVAVNALGTTVGSNERSQVTTGTTSTVTLNWAAVAGATGYRIYRGTATGAQTAYQTAGAVTTFTDTGTAGTAGTVPVTNTTGLAAPVQNAPTVASPGVTTAISTGVFTES